MTVYLVGAGPGDPGLLTVRGAELVAAADVLVVDHDCPDEIVALAPPSAERVVVPNRDRLVSTSDRTDLLRSLVRRAHTASAMVRLVAGDPFVFASGAAEAEALLAEGIEVEVVGGVSAATAAPAAAGVAVTSGPGAAPLMIVSPLSPAPAGIDWAAFVGSGASLVAVDADNGWPELATQLVDGGMPAETPAAVVVAGTQPDQQSRRARLGDVVELRPTKPAIVVVGACVAHDLPWFEARPLFGKRVVVTRTAEQAGQLSRALRIRGATPIEIPAIVVTDPPDGEPLRRAVQQLGEYDWLVLTSPNGARRTCDALRDTRQLGGVSVAAIGPGTASALADYNIVADLVPHTYVAEALLDAFPAPPTGGGRVLLARALDARQVLPEGLAALGWDVEVVPVYQTVAPAADEAMMTRLADAEAITFTSSSTVRNFVDLVGPQHMPSVVACIGPITAATARSMGLHVHVEAAEHTITGLVSALEGWYERPEGPSPG